MPEGDTVWLTAHRLHRALHGRQLTLSEFRVPALATVDLRGRRVNDVLARGKHLLCRIDDDLTLHSHLRMDGSWYLTAAGAPPPRRHPAHMIRVLLGNTEWTATGFRIHDLRLLARGDEHTVVGHLGPDLLGPDWNPELAVANLSRDPSAAIGDALLDQRNLAGIGNMYKAEVLFVRHLDPWTPVAEVGDLSAVVDAAHRLLLMNRDHPEQSTTGYTGRGREHWVYERGGQPCLRCRTPVRRAEQGPVGRTRGTYWCPTCQPGPGPETTPEPDRPV